MNEKLIHARVSPAAKKESLIEKPLDIFEIRVRETAERNAANNRVRELIAQHFGVSVRAVSIRAGHHSSNKMLRVIL